MKQDLAEAFRLLELPESATHAEVKEAYKLLSTVWHPDRFKAGGETAHKAEQKLKKINGAYSLLEQAFAKGDVPKTTARKAEKPKQKKKPRLHRFEAVYLDGDPRAQFGNRKCTLSLSRELLKMTFNGQEELRYRTKDLLGISVQGEAFTTPAAPASFVDQFADVAEINCLILYLRDPEEIVPYFAIKLEMAEGYSRKLFLKRIGTVCPLTPTQKAATRQKTEHPVLATITNIIALDDLAILAGAIAVLVAVYFLAEYLANHIL